MFRFTIRRKLLFFSIALALLPLGIAGRTMIRITQDELKSSANEQMETTINQLSEMIDEYYNNTWLAPILLIRNAVDNETLGIGEKISLMTAGIIDIPDIVSLQVTIIDLPVEPLMTVKDDFAESLRAASLDPIEVLRVPRDRFIDLTAVENAVVGEIVYVETTDDWLLTLLLPLQNRLAGQTAALAARINLRRLRESIEHHAFNRTGTITLVEADGRQIFDSEREVPDEIAILDDPLRLLASGSRMTLGGGDPYLRPDGEMMLGGYGFPEQLDLAIIVEQKEADAYMAIAIMVNSLLLYVLLGFAVAVIGAVVFAIRISRPILEIDRVAESVSQGNLRVRVKNVRSKDEIGDLAQRINEMIQGLLERFNLEKFVSGETIAAVKGVEEGGVKLGGERRLITVFFSDIRGFTAFSEAHEPEVVIEMLNTHLRHQAEIVNRYAGDIDKYVGDELVAVFQGPDMVKNAVLCAIEIQNKMTELTAAHPEWNISIGIGINTGEVVMGAMGSEARMDYTIIGDTVNLGARLCSAAGRGQILLSKNSRGYIADLEGVQTEALPPMKVKGKKKAIEVYELKVND